MKILKTVEMEDGAYEVKANFSPQEIDIIIEVGISTLLQQGAIPFKAMTELSAASFAPTTDTEQ